MAKASTASTGRSAKAEANTAPPAAVSAKAVKTKAIGQKSAVKGAALKAAAATAPVVAKKTTVSKTAVLKKSAAPAKVAAKIEPPRKATTKLGAIQKTDTPKTDTRKTDTRKTGASAATAAKTSAKGLPKAAGSRLAAAANSSKSVAVKTAAPRRSNARTAVPIPTARRGRSATVTHKSGSSPASKASAPGKASIATAKPTARAPQVFSVSHLNEADFKADGLRTYAQYRDLGMAAATGALCQAHVIRFVPPCTDEVRKRHLHQADLQLVYILKGWMKNEFEGHGEQMMSVGSCWLQPSGIKHTVLDYSADCEVLEIIVPADFTTEDLT